jgi:hypothetical protein
MSNETMTRKITGVTKRTLLAKSGNKCAFPDCDAELVDSAGRFLGTICHIEALAPGGPRYNPNRTIQELSSLDNLIALCPYHHVLVDAEPFIYTAERLRAIKDTHEKNVEKASAVFSVQPIRFDKIAAVPFRDAFGIWQQNRANGDEEFWQRFFCENPHIIAQAVPNHIIMLGQKCYVGGKSIENQGGNIVDFLYATSSSKCVVLVEIKTPITKLVGCQYRSNAYSLTEELTGSVVQVLNYRDELLKNYYSLSGQESPIQFSAFNPRCLVVAGNLENLSAVQRKSFELFRSNSSAVVIVTFDELFAKVQDLIDLAGG